MLANIILFLCIFIIYTHLLDEWKMQDKLELFETDYTDYDDFQQISRMKQPFVCNYKEIVSELWESNLDLSLIDEWNVINNENELKVHYNTLDLVLEKKYISFHNQEVIRNSSLLDRLLKNDEYLQPHLNYNAHYDILMGSANNKTTGQYHVYSRQYIVNYYGEVTIRLLPWKYIKEVSVKYSPFHFYTNTNLWNNKDNCIELKLQPGELLYIPPYWWYSYEFNTQSCLLSFSYQTFANNIVNLPHYIKQFIQTYTTEPAYSVKSIDRDEEKEKEQEDDEEKEQEDDEEKEQEDNEEKEQEDD